MGKIVHFKPVGNVNELHLIFPISTNKIAYCPYVKPIEYISTLFNDQRKEN